MSFALLITFANSLDPGQAKQKVGPGLEPNCFTLMVFVKEFFEKVALKYNQLVPLNETYKFSYYRSYLHLHFHFDLFYLCLYFH